MAPEDPVLEEVGQDRVRYGETDQMRFAYHGHAAVWFDIARTELLRRRGQCYRILEDQGWLLPVLALHVDYHLAARYDDGLGLWAGHRPRIVAGRVSPLQFEFVYEVRRGLELCYSGWTRHCFLREDPAGLRRPARMPLAFRELLLRPLPGAAESGERP